MNEVRDAMEMIMRKSTGLGNEFEVEAQKYAVMIINNLIKEGEYDMPYEMYLKKYNYELFHPFGCHTFT